jgi:hypothetical protein
VICGQLPMHSIDLSTDHLKTRPVAEKLITVH